MSETNPRAQLSRPVKVGDVVIGGGFPVIVQTMWKSPLTGVDDRLLEDVKRLQKAGCGLLRFAVPSLEQADILGALQKKTALPLVADVHFDYKIALACLRRGVAKLRLNPGNLGPAWKAEEVIKAARAAGVPLRIGINAGSLNNKLRREKDVVRAMLSSAEEELEILARFDFREAVFSFKASAVDVVLEVNRAFRKRFPYPLHLGVTEAGPLVPGIVKNTAALYTLLKEGIGDTVRVSLTANPLDEVQAGREILRAAGLTQKGINIVSCPACGRSEFDVESFYERLAPTLAECGKDATIALMGCPVNGPGEARHADLGITGSGGRVLIFKKGEIIRRELIDDALEAFLEELRAL